MKKQKEDSVSEKDIVFDGTFWIDKNGVKHRYVDPMSDEGFKILFGSEGKEELLMALLNEVIPDANIVQLSYKNNEHFGMLKEDGKAVFDVYCEDADEIPCRNAELESAPLQQKSSLLLHICHPGPSRKREEAPA